MYLDEDLLIRVNELLGAMENTQNGYSVVGIVDSARFSEIPSKRSRYERYCVLDMQILDDSCTVTRDTKKTLTCRLWGNVTKNHLRHMFVPGSIILLVDVYLTTDNYHNGRLTLQQRGYNSKSLAYILVEQKDNDGNIISSSFESFTGIGAAGGLNGSLQLLPERYPLLCSRITHLRNWAVQVINSRMSSNSKLHNTVSPLVSCLTEAASLSGTDRSSNFIDLCVNTTLYTFTSVTNLSHTSDTSVDNKYGKSDDAMSTNACMPLYWQYTDDVDSGHERKGKHVYSAIDVHDKSDRIARMDISTKEVENALHNCISKILLQDFEHKSHVIRLKGDQKQHVQEELVSSKSQQSHEISPTGDIDSECDDDAAAKLDTTSHAQNVDTCKTITIKGHKYYVTTLDVTMMLQSVRVLRSFNNTATVLLAENHTSFQAWCGDFLHGYRTGSNGSNIPISCNWEQFTKLVMSPQLSVPQLVSVHCNLKAAHFHNHPQYYQEMQANKKRNINIPTINNLVQVIRPIGTTVSVDQTIMKKRTASAMENTVESHHKNTTTSHWDFPNSSHIMPQVTYKDAMFELAPFPLCTDSKTKEILPTQNSSLKLSEPVSSNLNEYAPCDFYNIPYSGASQFTQFTNTPQNQQQQQYMYSAPCSNIPNSIGTSSDNATGTQTSEHIIRALATDTVLTECIFSCIPACLAAISLTRYTSGSSLPSEPHKKMPRMDVHHKNTVLEVPSDETLCDSLPSYNYASAVRRLAASLQLSCSRVVSKHSSATVKQAVEKEDKSFPVNVDLLILPKFDENGMIVMGKQHEVVVQALHFNAV